MADERELNLPRLPLDCKWISHDETNNSFIIRLWDGRQQHFREEWRAIKWAKQEAEA